MSTSTVFSSAAGVFTCTVCSQPLSASSFYERGGHAYCAADFLKTFLSCQICGDRIIYGQGAEETEEERKERKRKEAIASAEGKNQQYLTLAEDRIVHNRCLKCECCAKPLGNPSSPPVPGSKSTGGSISLFQSGGKFYCQADYLKLFGNTCTHCGLVISDNQSIQLTPDEDDESSAPAGVTAWYHLACFTCSICRADLRQLEAAQDEADEKAFERGEMLDPSLRPPVYQSDSRGRVFCWDHWLEAVQSGMITAKRGSMADQLALAAPSNPEDGTFSANPLLILPQTRQASRSFATMMHDNDDLGSSLHSMNSTNGLSAPNSFQGNSFGQNEVFTGLSHSIAAIEELDETALSQSLSRTRS